MRSLKSLQARAHTVVACCVEMMKKMLQKEELYAHLPKLAEYNEECFWVTRSVKND